MYPFVSARRLLGTVGGLVLLYGTSSAQDIPGSEPVWNRPVFFPLLEGLLLLLVIALVINIYQRRLEKVDRRLTTLLHNLPGMAYRCHNDGRDWVMEYVSAGAYILTGYSPEELQGATGVVFGDLIVEEDAERVAKEVVKATCAGEHFQVEYRIRRKDGSLRWVWEQGIRVDRDPGEGMLEGFICDVNEQKRLQDEKSKAMQHLKNTLKQLKHLKGIIPICSHCQKVRNDDGDWQLLEEYIRTNTDADFSHGICAECAKELYPEFWEDPETEEKKTPPST